MLPSCEVEKFASEGGGIPNILSQGGVGIGIMT